MPESTTVIDPVARDPAEPTVRLPVAVLVVVATLVVVLLAVWGTTVVSAERLPTGLPRDPPPPQAAPVQTELKIGPDRQVSFEEFTVTLAGDPFRCQDSAFPVDPAFDSFTVCSSVVHADYYGKGGNWSAQTGVALLDTSVVSTDLAETAKKAWQELGTASYTIEDDPRVTRRKGAPVQIAAPEGSAYSYEARVNVSRKSLDTRYDTLVVYVIRLQGGRNVMVFSDFPNDGSQAALDAVVASFGTISART